VEFAYPHSHLHFDETSGSMAVSMVENGNTDGPVPGPETGAAPPQSSEFDGE